MIILDGKEYSEELIKKYKKQTKGITLAIIYSSDSEEVRTYIKSKSLACTSVGIEVKKYKVNSNKKEIAHLIEKLNKDKNITGIIIEYPFPYFEEMVNLIKKDKDVEGLTKENIYDLYIGKENIIPCTAKGIIKLLEKANIKIEGKNIVIIGRGLATGKPLELALQNRNGTVTLCHSKTKNLKDITKKADIIISMTGINNLVKKEMVKDNFIGIDAGFSKVNGKITGDFDYEKVKAKASYLTKVPGGIGPMTTAMLIENLIELKR